jgi:hypothetical protein
LFVWWVKLGTKIHENFKNIVFGGVAFKDQITMAGLILVGEFLKTSNTEEVSEECERSVRGVKCWSAVARKRQSLGTASSID